MSIVVCGRLEEYTFKVGKVNATIHLIPIRANGKEIACVRAASIRNILQTFY